MIEDMAEETLSTLPAIIWAMSSMAAVADFATPLPPRRKNSSAKALRPLLAASYIWLKFDQVRPNIRTMTMRKASCTASRMAIR